MKINEENFIKHIKNRDAKALRFAVDTYANLVYKVVYSVFNSNDYIGEIEECVNDVFLSLWNNVESFHEEKGNFKSWLIAISKYKAIDYKRKLYKEKSLECIDDVIIIEEKDTEKLVILEENREEILKAISELKDVDKEIFIKRYFLDENINNIAKALGINRSTVDNRLSRGRKILKEKLNFLREGII
ncbi:RNA polymerase sigma-70 factor (ECF subfamily) [Clostridium tetanomorphum]|uniref:Sigma-70 family RNA polymerase sigma factor n=1 Tax=Clostridium tetanomorphum TaxID=1553 RepID=A0A923J213_CLOTT|nr:sigma-70 family RNA polymerase sigma factor [Clostridium tetanomorphum]KAJ51045.1 RNA polymerase factor sigma-70 [Clostridium tetanomorphum DSM 665]MBC2399354.1 sigma-70 family RNA polymerase sigma factor [Clostridium tetanomorphum]MBP1865855.1 RNA polymerase sigma-70 factor (ECF subfamily) [Clostridium tetanomorphum]NRS85304.1 RNA polymerase sigma-70 factor (ECF subfamily) [Clostridium tetanomorphum]NRZ98483.1 RNA polymerase sigma-70 factor (ECF subfamily) [Clostridium tetanomorphum]